MTEKEIVENIKKSKKYKAVYVKTVERIVADCIVRFGEKRAEKEAKNLLHQVWGAFYETRPDFKKILNKIEIENSGRRPTSSEDFKKIISSVLKLQSSVQERVGILEEFYKKIFEVTGIPNSIIDHACGLNPLTLPWMSLPETTVYKAYDIDEEEIEFLKSVFDLLKIKNVEARMGDVLVDEFSAQGADTLGRPASGWDYADVVFMLKLLPCLEHQKKGCSLEILKRQKCKFIVVSYPIKSISGKEKGMAEFYRNSFMNMVKSENWKIEELLFDSELVFIVEK